MRSVPVQWSNCTVLEWRTKGKKILHVFILYGVHMVFLDTWSWWSASSAQSRPGLKWKDGLMFPLLSQLFIDKLCFPSGSFFISAKISQDSMGRYSEEVHVSLEAMVHLGGKKTPQGQQNMHLFRTFLSSNFFSVFYSRPALVSLKDCVMFFFLLWSWTSSLTWIRNEQ